MAEAAAVEIAASPASTSAWPLFAVSAAFAVVTPNTACAADNETLPAADNGTGFDFEEMFSVLEGEIEATFRGKKSIIRAGETINIPAKAPH